MKYFTKVCLACFACIFIFSFPMFSESFNDEKSQQSESFRKIGASVGTRISVLGLSPTVSLIANRFEVEAACGLSFYGFLWKDYRVGLMPQASLGYTSPLFETGWKHGVGFTYSYLSDALNDGTSGLITAMWYGGLPKSYGGSSDIFGIHVFSIYYKSGWQFKKIGIYFRFGFPFFALPTDASSSMSGYQWTGLRFSDVMSLITSLSLASFVSQSVGVRWVM